ncbi:MAG TPA: monovalent cation:proton antiporter-2 (CPA2) family protein [Flavisolibacter sp.]|jgi:CPA2 family monovalent cation:H+ antiporter-2|nr:monovalent cation:proton antiporter-2 (CPA2) family protein [Flavisolibacter sp.]
MSGGFLQQAIIYLAAAIVCVPIAKKLGLGSVLGYLAAGILIGPSVLGFIGREGQDIMHFAEFGVVMMLFLVGLELEPAKFWKMKNTILGMGSLQVGITAVLIFAAAWYLGLSWQSALSIGLALAMSSTAIVLQSLKEKNLLGTAYGQSSFAVLLFQDIAVIPILAILPLLATTAITAGDEGHKTLLGNAPGWLQAISILGAIVTVVAAGKFIIVPLLRMIATTRLRELFTALALLIVVSIAYLMELVGLSPALGTFLAGVVLANSEYRHELESDIDPFKGLLLGLFFLAVGASINFTLIASHPGKIISLVLAIMAVKTFVLLVTGKLFKLKMDQNLLFAFGLSQVGEFAFVLFSFISELQIIDQDTTDLMMGVTAISMVLTPLFSLVIERFVLPRMGTLEAERKPADTIEDHNAIIISGFGHFGNTIGRFLRANGVEATIVDNDSDRVNMLRKMGFKVYYGDATRLDLLKAAGAEAAKIIIIAIDQTEARIQSVETIQKHFPHLKIMARAKNRYDAYELMEMGLTDIYRESLDTSVRLGVDALKSLGFRSYTTYRSAQKFIRYDEAALSKLMKERNTKGYIDSARREIELQEKLLAEDRHTNPADSDHAWDSNQLRQSIGND